MVPTVPPSSDGGPVSRRRALAALGAGALAATAGCATRDAVGPLRDRVHRSDADLSGAAGPWPTRGADPRRSGTAAGSAPPADANVFRVTSVGRLAGVQPTIDGPRAYLGVDRRTANEDEASFSGVMAVALDATPDRRVTWRVPADRATTAVSPTVAGNTVVAPLGQGVTALDAGDGRVRWRTAAGGGTTAVVGETCFTCAERLVALDAVTGRRRWESPTTRAAPSGFAVTADAVALACGDGGEGALYGFERSDGTTRWRYGALGESYASPVTDGARAYAVNTSGVLHAVSLDGGERAWTREFEGESYQRVAVADGTVYAAGSNDPGVVALDADTGRRRWRRSVGVGGPSPPAVTPDSLLVVAPTSEGRRLLVLDRASGEERYRFELPDGLYPEVQPVAGEGVAYVVAGPSTETQGHLYAVR